MRAGVWLVLVALGACELQSGASGSDAGGPVADVRGNDGGTEGDPPSCDEAPLVAWANWGDGFLTTYCQPCHASSSPDRHGAPDTVVFDSLDDVRREATSIAAMALGVDPAMPPGGGVPAEELALLEVWLRCRGEDGLVR